MQAKLTELVPKIKQAAIDTEKIMVIVAQEKEIADKMAEGINREKLIVQESVDKANAIKEDCEADLAIAMPILKEAMSALDVIEKR